MLPRLRPPCPAAQGRWFAEGTFVAPPERSEGARGAVGHFRSCSPPPLSAPRVTRSLGMGMGLTYVFIPNTRRVLAE